MGTSFGEKTAANLKEKGVSAWLIVVLISMLPIVELRLGIPIGIAVLGLPWYWAVLFSVLGNMLPIPLLLLLMDWGFAILAKFRWGKRFTNWLFTRTRNKGKIVEKYEEIGLAIFVGIPLPGTGAWTGALAARIFGLSFWKSMLWIFIGVLLAAVAVTALTLLGTTMLG
jgi:uncharacterized membrane protein